MSKDLPSIDDFGADENLPSIEDFITEEKAEELPSVEDFIEKEEEVIEEATQTIEDADGNSFAEVKDIVPPWPELVRMINDVRADIPDIPEVKYYDQELQDLAEQISKLPEVRYYDREVEAICEQIDAVREQVKNLPEVKYYDEQVDAIEDRIDSLQTDVANLPEVKYYDAEIEAICEAIDQVKASIPKFPKWVNEVNEVPDFSWIGKTFSVIDDDFIKVSDKIEGLRGKVDFELEQLSEALETKHFNTKVKIESDVKDLDEKVNTRIDEEKEKIWKELRSSSLKIWEHHKTFKDDDRKLKKQILGEYNNLKKNIDKELKEINYTSVKTDELLLKYFTELKEEISKLPEVKYYDKDIDYVKTDIKDLYKTVWELSMKDIIDMARHRGYFIDQSQSLNLFMEGATMAKLTSMHFYAWKSGLKTGMYYLRTKSAVDAIKFTLDNTKKKEPVKETVDAASAVAAVPSPAETAQIPVEPLTPEELKEMIAKSKGNQDDDCLMCGS